MTCCCNSNPAQYERNRRFRHLVHVLGRQANGAKLPSEGLWLNASKSESHLVRAMIILFPDVGRYRYASCAQQSPQNRALPVTRNVAGAITWSIRYNVGVQNHLQTTWLLVKVLYSVEQPPHCDLLRLSFRLDDLFFYCNIKIRNVNQRTAYLNGYVHRNSRKPPPPCYDPPRTSKVESGIIFLLLLLLLLLILLLLLLLLLILLLLQIP
jgi:hypothetical protein